MFIIAFLGFIGFIISIVALVKGNVKRFKIQSRKQAVIVLIISIFVMGIFAPDNAETDTTASKDVDGTEEKNDTSNSNSTVSEPNQEALQSFEGTVEMDVIDENKILMTVNSNVPDGGVFELNLLDSSFNMLIEQATIQNGKIEYTFDIPEEWEIGYIAGSAWFRFNSDEAIQPDNIKDLYGPNGEHMKGELTGANNVGGYNGMTEAVTIAYPSEDIVKEKTAQLFVDALSELISVSDGVIIDIKPHSTEGWDIPYVYISDAWYNSAEHEKERFAEQVGDSVKSIILNSGMASGDYVSVYFKDSYGKDLATPKILGGYNIKR